MMVSRIALWVSIFFITKEMLLPVIMLLCVTELFDLNVKAEEIIKRLKG